MNYDSALYVLVTSGYLPVNAQNVLFQASKFGQARDGNVIVYAQHRRHGHVRYSVLNAR